MYNNKLRIRREVESQEVKTRPENGPCHGQQKQNLNRPTLELWR